ncbi:polyprotein [Cattleya purple ringspot virus]
MEKIMVRYNDHKGVIWFWKRLNKIEWIRHKITKNCPVNAVLGRDFLACHECGNSCFDLRSHCLDWDLNEWVSTKRGTAIKVREIHYHKPSLFLGFFYLISYWMIMASNSLQQAYGEAGARLKTSASSFAKAISVAQEKMATVTEDRYVKILNELTKKSNVYAKPSILSTLARQIASKPRMFIAFEQRLVQATKAVEDGAEEYDVPLSEISNVHNDELELLKGERASIEATTTVKLDVIRLKSASTTPQSNAGAVVVAAVDGRAENPEDAVIGGMVHLPHQSQEAECVFFPSYCLNSADPYLDKALRLLTVGTGFNLERGSIVSSVSYSLVGEVSARPGRSSFSKVMADALSKYSGEALCHNALPIHPHRPRKTKVPEIVIPWKDKSRSIRYSGENNGLSVWSVDQKKGATGIKIEGLDSIRGKAPERLNQSRRTNFTADDDQEFRFEGDNPYQLNDRKDLPGMTRFLEKDEVIVSSYFTLDKTADGGKLLKSFFMFEDCVDPKLKRPSNLIYTFYSCAYIKPIFKVEIIYEVPLGYTVPLIICYDPLRQVDATTPRMLTLMLESQIVNPRDRPVADPFYVRPVGHTGLFPPWRDGFKACGAFHVIAVGHSLASLEGNIVVEMRISLVAGTELGSGEYDPALRLQGDFEFFPGRSVHYDNLPVSYPLAHLLFDSKTPAGSTYLTLVKPAIGYVYANNRKSSKNLSAALFSFYNFWKGKVVLEICISSRLGVAGKAAIYFIPSGVRLEETSMNWLAQYPNQVYVFSGSSRLIVEFDNHTWLGGSMCYGQGKLEFEKYSSVSPTIVTILQAPPSSLVSPFTTVQVFYRVIAYKNLTLSERASFSYTKAPVAVGSAASAMVNVDPTMQMEACISQGLHNQSRIATIVPFDGQDNTMCIFPASPIIYDDTFNPPAENMKQTKLVAGKIYRDHASLFSTLLAGAAYYKGTFRFWFVPTFEGDEYQTMDVTYLNSPLENYSFGMRKFDSSLQRTMFGGLICSHSERGKPCSILVEARDFFSRTRMRTSDLGPFLDVNGIFVINVAPQSSVSRLDIFCELVGPLELWGKAIGREDVAEGKNPYAPLTMLLPGDEGGFNEFFK